MVESDNIRARVGLGDGGRQRAFRGAIVATLMAAGACGSSDRAGDVPADTATVPAMSAVPPASGTGTDTVGAQVPTEHLIVPGVRVGRMVWSTSRKVLLRAYGPAYVDTAVHIGEGETLAGAEVAAGTDSAFAVIWDDPAKAHVREVRILGKTYRTAEGIRIGSTLADLEAAMGPFKLLGMSWDYAGTVLLEGTVWSEYEGLIILRLAPSAAGRRSAAYGRVRGDKPYPSDSPDVRALELTVRDLIVRLKPGAAW